MPPSAACHRLDRRRETGDERLDLLDVARKDIACCVPKAIVTAAVLSSMYLETFGDDSVLHNSHWLVAGSEVRFPSLALVPWYTCRVVEVKKEKWLCELGFVVANSLNPGELR